MQSKSEEIKAHEINRLIMAHKEKYPDDFGDLKERFIAIFGKNETKIILDQYAQVIKKNLTFSDLV